MWYEIKRKINLENTYFSWIGILSIFFIVGGFSFAIFTAYQESRGSLNIITGNLYGYIDSESFDGNKSITLSEEEDKIIKITLKNVNEKEIKINLYYTETDRVEVYYLDEEEIPPKEEGIVLEKGEEKTYRIRLINKTKEEKRVEFGSEVGLSSKELPFPEEKRIIDQYLYSEKILNEADPVLRDRLIPVIIDSSGKVTYANVQEKWYKYDEKEWANAVILIDNPSKEYQVGNQIEEKDIESYFVWIPKYRYRLWSLGLDTSLTKTANKEQSIEIEFGLKNTNDNLSNECTTPMLSGATGQCQIGKWMTHPAFLAFDTTGLWVGKFETGNKDATDSENAKQNINNSNKVQIKPNVYSWRYIQIANAYQTSYSYERELNSHMMKNTEWGAVAYLSHSKYGTCNGDVCTEIRINNNSAFVTGFSAKQVPTIGWNAYTDYGETLPSRDGDKNYNYLNPISTISSTTGNYTGIYDMSGGAWEWVMGVMFDNSGKPIVGESTELTSGFAGKNGDGTTSNGTVFPTDERYYDKYNYSTSETAYNLRILGDAISEMGPFENTVINTATAPLASWQKATIFFVFNKHPWFPRGHYPRSGTSASIFTANADRGQEHGNVGFRIVLAFK